MDRLLSFCFALKEHTYLTWSAIVLPLQLPLKYFFRCVFYFLYIGTPADIAEAVSLQRFWWRTTWRKGGIKRNLFENWFVAVASAVSAFPCRGYEDIPLCSRPLGDNCKLPVFSHRGGRWVTDKRYTLGCIMWEFGLLCLTQRPAYI